MDANHAALRSSCDLGSFSHFISTSRGFESAMRHILIRSSAGSSGNSWKSVRADGGVMVAFERVWLDNGSELLKYSRLYASNELAVLIEPSDYRLVL